MPKATKKNSTPRRTLRKTSPPPTRPIVDPIFAAIENHQKLDRAWLDLPVLNDARKREVDRARDAADKAAWKMARTKSITAAGAAALLE
jgi:hypothetical protein